MNWRKCQTKGSWRRALSQQKSLQEDYTENYQKTFVLEWKIKSSSDNILLPSTSLLTAAYQRENSCVLSESLELDSSSVKTAVLVLLLLRRRRLTLMPITVIAILRTIWMHLQHLIQATEQRHLISVIEHHIFHNACECSLCLFWKLINFFSFLLDKQLSKQLKAKSLDDEKRGDLGTTWRRQGR